MITIPSSWGLAAGSEIRVGTKRVFQLFPKPLVSRVKADRKKSFEEKHRETMQQLARAIADFDGYKSRTPENTIPQSGKADLETRLEQLKAMESAIEDVGPVYDVVLFKDAASQQWKAAVDTTETGDFSSAKLMGEFRVAQEYSTFSDMDSMNYSFNVWDEGSTSS